jgi:predicted aspartyl protease
MMISFPMVAFLVGYLLFDRGGDIILRGNNNILPFELHDNRIFVTATLNGKEAHLIMDTGGNSHTILDEALAKKLGLPLKKGRSIYGTGNNPVSSYTSHVDSICISNLVLTNQDITVISFSEIKKALNLKYLDGLVSSEVFHKFTVEIDYQGKRLILHKPEIFTASPTDEAIPFTLLYGNTPVIEGAVDGLKGKFVIDTGDRSSFTLFRNFARENNFFDRYGLTDTLMTGYGIGGPIMGRFLTIRSIMLGDKVLTSETRSRIPTIEGGAFDRDDEIIGSVGNQLLATFASVTFDFRLKKMYVKKML